MVPCSASMTATLFAFEYMLSQFWSPTGGLGSGDIWNMEDLLSISLGRRERDLKRSLRVYLLITAFPVSSVSVSMASAAYQSVPFVC